jgi:hypothetical protein
LLLTAKQPATEPYSGGCKSHTIRFAADAKKGFSEPPISKSEVGFLIASQSADNLLRGCYSAVESRVHGAVRSSKIGSFAGKEDGIVDRLG